MSKRKTSPRPPTLALRLMKRLFPEPTGAESRIGDFEEAFNRIAGDKGPATARVWCWMNLMRSCPYAAWRSLTWGSTLLRNDLRIALRGLTKQKTGSLICLAGLSVGLAFCIMTYLFIRDEFSYDRFHDQASSIHSIVINNHFQERSHRHIPVPMAPVLKEHFQDVKDFARLVKRRNVTVRYEDRIFNETVGMTDPQFLRIFSFPLIKGHPGSALNSENALVLTRSTAHKYFGSENPIGRTLVLSFRDKQKPFEVTGIAEDIPGHSTVSFSILIHLTHLNFIDSQSASEDWTRFSAESYLLLKEGGSPEDIEAGILAAVKPRLAPYYELMRKWEQLVEQGETVTFNLQNIRDMHLKSANVHTPAANHIKRTYALVGIALLILSIAVINYINMSIGRAAERSAEIGIRKVLGAGRKQLIRQFWSESTVITTISMIVGLTLAGFMLPVFNSLSNKNLSVHSLLNADGGGILLLLILFVAILAGSVPALIMANFKITEILQGRCRLKRKSPFTKTLVILQFSITVFLLVAAWIMSQQIGFIQGYDLGFNKDNVLIVDLQERHHQKSRELLRLFQERIRSHHAVKGVSGSMNSPNRTFLYGLVHQKGKKINVYYNRVHNDYLATMKMRLVKGRDFSKAFSSEASSVIVNQKLVDELDLDRPLGKTITMGPDPPLEIIGVVENFNYSSLEEEIGPAALNMDPTLGVFYAIVRIAPENTTEVITHLQNQWKSIRPDRPFKFSFLDEDIGSFYRDEKRWNAIVRNSSLFTLLIAGMGIFGMTMMTISSRVKEIGIRKVLGASIPNILRLIMRELVVVIALANLAAWPLTWFIMRRWLQNFAFRTTIGIEAFLIPMIITASVAILTSGGHAIRAAAADPIESLRYE